MYQIITSKSHQNLSNLENVLIGLENLKHQSLLLEATMNLDISKIEISFIFMYFISERKSYT